MRILFISKITGIFGAACSCLPGATQFVLHFVWAASPYLPFMDRMLVSVAGMADRLTWLHPDMVLYYRDGTTSYLG